VHSLEPVARHDATRAYRKLVSVLSARAARMGSADAEGAAQEALKRSLANPKSRAAVDYFFHADPPAAQPPEWPLDQLLAWLHGVLRFVVREERARLRFRREVPADGIEASWVRDEAPDPLEQLIDRQQQSIVRECLDELGDDYRTVLMLRIAGVKYADIAVRLGVSENTVATWIRRGTLAATERIRARLDARPHLAAVEQAGDG
jgi:RNA polymerase sigma factor (sigma-70 family)